MFDGVHDMAGGNPEGNTEGLREGYYSLRGGEFEDAGTCAIDIKATLKSMGVAAESARRAAVTAFEAEMNVIIHAVAGTLTYTIGKDEILITVTDMGPGIADLDLAMTEGFSTAPKWAKDKGWGSGLGLPNIKRNSDSLEIDSKAGEGTTVRIKVKLMPGDSD